jgi:DNA polymerase-1
LHSGSRAHDLDTVAHEYLKAKLPSLPARAATDQEFAALAAAVAVFPALCRALAADLEAKNLSRIFAEIEMPLIPVLGDMQRAGIKLDLKALKKLSKDFAAKLASLSAAITRAAGVEFNLNSPSQLAEVLFVKLGLPVKGIKKTKSGYSTAAPELEKIMDAHPIVPLISEYRELAKLQNTYVETLPKLIGADGRLHTTFNQTVTSTGRLSSSDPNLQNIPIKTELGNKIREAFVAAPGKKLVAADYSQIELRLVAHLAKDQAFIQAFREGADIHTRTAAEVWGVPEAKVTSEQRRAAKAINFGIIYGMGPRALARATAMRFEEAQAFIDKYFALHTAIRDYLDGTKAFAHAAGYVETAFGRRRYLPELSSGVPMLVAAGERMAINMPVQGTAADLMKKAMLEVDAWLRQSREPASLILQVHDELVLEVDARSVDPVARGLKEIMEGVATLDVPLLVDVEVGDRWGAMEEWKK